LENILIIEDLADQLYKLHYQASQILGDQVNIAPRVFSSSQFRTGTEVIQDALSRLSGDKIGLILMDYDLGMQAPLDGGIFTKILHKVYPQIPIIAISGRSNKNASMIQAGAVTSMHKNTGKWIALLELIRDKR